MKRFFSKLKPARASTELQSSSLSSPLPLPGLCQFCTDAVKTILRQTQGHIRHFDNIGDLKFSASRRCQLCEVVLESLGHEPDMPRDHVISWLYNDAANIRVSLISKSRQPPFYFHQILLEPFWHEDQRSQRIALDDPYCGLDIVLNPIDAIPQVVLPWISNCLDTHENCRQQQNAPLPSRVIDVGGFGDTTVYLRDGGGFDGRYTILSHCWGKTPILATTSETLLQRQNGISFEDLPPTFRDAVIVTRTLGVKFLWIDSLCIIQDNTLATDWKHESAKMLAYYQNAYVTIGAFNCPDSSSGFLHLRDQKVARTSIPGIPCFREQRKELWELYNASVLETRAWCLQERLLSTRTIHFGEREIIWECQTSNEREGGARNAPIGENSASRLSDPNEWKRVLAENAVDTFKHNGGLAVWYYIVDQYSSRGLTNPTDMLPALYGVANHIEKRAHFTYMHGLWAEDLARGLLWSKTEKGEVTGAPTWSWAATTGTVKTSRLQLSPTQRQIQFIRHDEDGELVLRSRCREIGRTEKEIKNEGLTHASLHLDFGKLFYGTRHVDGRSNDESDDSYRGPYKVMEITGEYFLILAPLNAIHGPWKRVGYGISGTDSMFDECELEEICLV